MYRNPSQSASIAFPKWDALAAYECRALYICIVWWLLNTTLTFFLLGSYIDTHLLKQQLDKRCSACGPTRNGRQARLKQCRHWSASRVPIPPSPRTLHSVKGGRLHLIIVHLTARKHTLQVRRQKVPKPKPKESRSRFPPTSSSKSTATKSSSSDYTLKE